MVHLFLTNNIKILPHLATENSFLTAIFKENFFFNLIVILYSDFYLYGLPEFISFFIDDKFKENLEDTIYYLIRYYYGGISESEMLNKNLSEIYKLIERANRFEKENNKNN